MEPTKNDVYQAMVKEGKRLKKIELPDVKIFSEYETANSWLARIASFEPLQRWLGKRIARKAMRKYEAYKNMLAVRALLDSCGIDRPGNNQG